MLIYLIPLILSRIILSLQSCQESQSHCEQCNPVTKLCVKCNLDVLSPDKNGGCGKSNNCIIGENYCIECNEEGTLCNKCFEGYFPDNNGGCSYTDNCEIAYKGRCIECKDSFILIGKGNYPNEEIKICKSINSDDLKNCKKINLEKGLCEKCEEGYYLGSLDKKCTNIENCLESVFGVCKKCIYDYYLDKKDNKCKHKTEKFKNCKLTINGVILVMMVSILMMTINV